MKKSEKTKLNVIAEEYLKRHKSKPESEETEADEAKESGEVQLAEKITGKEKHKPKSGKK